MTESTTAEPHADGESRATFLIGQTLGRIEHKVDSALSAQERIEAQQTQILEQDNDRAQEVKKLASDVVNFRDAVLKELAKVTERVDTLERAPTYAALPPMRAPMPSVTTEVKTELRNQHDSIRAVALRQEQLDVKQDEQTAILRALSRSPRVQVVLFILGSILFGALSAWQASRPPVVITAPAPVATPRALP